MCHLLALLTTSQCVAEATTESPEELADDGWESKMKVRILL